jgi:hypothetical protein
MQRFAVFFFINEGHSMLGAGGVAVFWHGSLD